MHYWLMKTEPDTFSIDDLSRDGKTMWSGVRNFAARNNMMQMSVGDIILFYHSSCPENGVYGLGKVVSAAQPDTTQLDKNSPYYDARATNEKAIWYCVEVGFVEKFSRPFLLVDIKNDTKLSGMMLIQRSRLSVQPVSETHFKYIYRVATQL